ncbi:MAG: TetR/AcrR family transcriptional regulator [Hydrogenophaga sp.]|uniref:TetR/AcrR family transcriptional regulator n=1 Tax=Hydrogenophaga sp. TaxID=1904254 RepID=UPI00275808DB|nr:TetR/AcrR family transcriptional regulator [Hydrogenophaga sp.]MDP2417140.1 TetR/AcrR family transcriptional regulator [Hydrogenophaga sp.]MDZ4186816.1 TetR/AcrR family transcriptional regulator [Hydrogenophaga sp.]
MPTISKTSATLHASRQSYHHGDLRQTLIDATELLLAERGPEGFSLREVARRSGVSAAAPTHHFGGSEGLLAAVATMAFEALLVEMEAGRERGGSDPVARLREQGVGYVRFALRYPGRFKLMFRSGLRPDVALSQAAHSAYVALEDSVRALLGKPEGAPLDPTERQAFWAIWSVVHGFAHLALAGQFDARHGGYGATPVGADQPDASLPWDQSMLVEVLPAMLEQQLAAWVQHGGSEPLTKTAPSGATTSAGERVG